MSVTAAGRGRPRPEAVRELRLARRRCVFWVVDEEFDGFAVQQLDKVDAVLFGRVTYEGFEPFGGSE